MVDNPTDKNTPELADLVKAAEPTARQKFMNFFGLGYGGNTAVAITSVKLAHKLFPNFIAKWEGKHEQKYIARKTEELIAPVADKLDAQSKAVLEEKIAKDAKAYGKKTVDSRLLSTGGFAMLPFQSGKQVKDYKLNVKKPMNDFRDACAAQGYTPEQTESALLREIDRQKANVVRGDKKAEKILDKAMDEPKFNALGPDAREDLPKWIVGRCVALGAAFGVQTIVDDRFSKKKDAMDNALAKIITRIVHPKGYGKKPDFNNAAFDGQEAPSTHPAGVDPKIHDIVRMVTTDAYMTTVAIATHMGAMNMWDKSMPKVTSKMDMLRGKIAAHGNNPGGPSV